MYFEVLNSTIKAKYVV